MKKILILFTLLMCICSCTKKPEPRLYYYIGIDEKVYIDQEASNKMLDGYEKYESSSTKYKNDNFVLNNHHSLIYNTASKQENVVYLLIDEIGCINKDIVDPFDELFDIFRETIVKAQGQNTITSYLSLNTPEFNFIKFDKDFYEWGYVAKFNEDVPDFDFDTYLIKYDYSISDAINNIFGIESDEDETITIEDIYLSLAGNFELNKVVEYKNLLIKCIETFPKDQFLYYLEDNSYVQYQPQYKFLVKAVR